MNMLITNELINDCGIGTDMKHFLDLYRWSDCWYIVLWNIL